MSMIFSRITGIFLSASSVLASLLCFFVLSADASCGAQDWSCRTLAGVAVVAIVVGTACALIFTSFAVILGRLLQVAVPAAKVLEPAPRAIKVAALLSIAHFVLFAVLGLLGLLPVGAAWWQGVFSLLSQEPRGTVIYVPIH
ncbi:hypothetical protein GM658_10800 [Pseudoduganella eburnea]|uniref:Uncharacterized protein n=1 Tax=Massilia eburnea TaxID=1776165 RepID=A0A6L6QG28_9BURK|nr:hypothetical protein [Massilia eburnea]MTW11091.1 hypothetical protein [Massilia eburnea]